MQQIGGSRVFSYFLVALGTFLMAAGVNLIYEPLSMVTGGFAGFAIIVKSITKPFFQEGIPVWITTTLLNIPLFFWAAWQRGRSFVKGTLFASLCFSFALAVIPVWEVVSKDYLMAAILGGAVSGTGLALVFSQSLSTGGTDLLSALLQKHIRVLSIARILMLIDGAVVLLGMGLFGLKNGLYAIIAVFITTKVMDGILDGLKFAKMVTIITGKGEEIGQEILTGVDRGVTQIHATGMYTGEQKDMLICVTSRKEVIRLNEIVQQTDPSAFFIISDVHEVFGEGFIKNKL